MITDAQPLTKQEANLIASVYKLLPDELPGFVGRQQQKDMIQFVARTFANDAHSIIEAPTGTGKSFGYQIPGIVLALSRDRRIVISTETANLQDQIAGRDLKVLSNILTRLGMEAPSVVAKGRERYICPVRLEEKAGQASLIDEDEANKAFASIADAWDGGQWDGLRDSLPFRVTHPIWVKVNNNRHACSNDRCPQAKQCPHMQVKVKLKQARIIVTNHSYLLSVIAAQFGSDSGKKNPVTDFERNYYAFDEAHHLHDRCIESFSNKAIIDEDVLNEAGRMLAAIGSSKVALLKIRAEAMKGIGNVLRSNLRIIVGAGEQHRFVLGKVPSILADLVQEYASAVKTICELMNEAIEDAKKNTTRASAQTIISNASAVSGQLDELLDALEEFGYEGDNPRAKWIDIRKGVFTIHAAPFDAGGLAYQMLWKNMRGAILTSATIASLGEFGPALAGLGLPKDTMTVKLSSPLDYTRARIVVPKFMVAANSPGHAMMVAAMIRSKAFSDEHRGSLIYFTSRKKMESVLASFTPEEQAVVILQGEMAPSAMIAEHKRRIDAGGRSILFGLDSIAEGVDLPGHYCTLVVIDKLPFPSPDDPILASHSEHLETKGLHPFAMLMLPRAGLKLAQVVGRLIRTEKDWGDVWVLDRRLVEKPYGARLVRSTPFAAVTQI